MPFSPKTLEEKPYNMCINCIHIGKNCDGPNFLAMSTERWCEWCHLRKEYLGWTNDHVAEVSEVGIATVERIMAGKSKDVRISSMQAVTKALVNGSWGQYPCALADSQEVVDNPDLIDRLNKADAECKRLQAVLERTNNERIADIAAAHSDDQKKIDFLKEQIRFQESQLTAKDKLLAERYAAYQKEAKKNTILVTALIVLAVVFVIVVGGALLVDLTNPDLGFFWRETKVAFETQNTVWKV